MADQTLDDFLGQPKTAAWRRYVKWIVGAVVIVLLILLATRLFGGSDKVQYATQEVQRGNLAVTVSATGKLAPTNQVDVGSELSGLVTTVYVEVNDRVTKGQALALIDTARLDDAIAQSRAALGAAQATVQQNEATVEQSRANLTRFREVSRLSGGRVPAKVEMDQAEADLARAIANLRAAQANVVSQRAQLSSNQTQRDRAVIRSPVNGVVLARQIDAGQTVAASFNTPTLFVIAEDLTNMELQVAIDEADVGAVKDGQPATFTVDAFPGQTFPARITRVDLGSNLSAQTTSSTSTSTTQSQVVSYAAILSVSNPDQQLRPGMTATAEITTKARDNVLLVPNAALRFTPAATDASAGKANDKGIAGALVPTRPRRGGGGAEKSATRGRGAQQQVYVLGADGTPQAVAVTTGETDGSVTEVTGGDLKPGMKVITGQMASGEAGKSSQGGGQRRQGSGGGQRQGGAPSGG
ncbi:efflux RND transporter periplasmic adaptor subunit [Sphingomonas sp. HF-S3]|uniref:Efflux RND transporter periplasmic adaptor subunit n=1 Tax=Sphingomonas rustica TaxID=3103142 RepID=A0ABV0B691_9SPHN